LIAAAHCSRRRSVGELPGCCRERGLDRALAVMVSFEVRVEAGLIWRA
jgi:hypothetical protein